MIRVFLLWLAALVLGLSAAPAFAQCQPGWLPGEGLPGVNGNVSALAVLSEGNLIVGGEFNQAGGVTANNIARYSPATHTWSALGAGVSDFGSAGVTALAVLPSGDVIVGGYFSCAGGTPASCVARYSPASNSWFAIGAGTNGTVRALLVLPDGDVIMGGAFTQAGGIAASKIVRYSPADNAWSTLGSGANDIVNALAVLPSGEVIVGGEFTNAGGVAATCIASFSPATNSWSALGSVVNSLGDPPFVAALAVLPGGEVMVGGQFTRAGAAATEGIARYSPATHTWFALGLGRGVGRGVYALAVLPDGNVIAGGDFSHADLVAAKGVARYSPVTNTWSAPGSGPVGRVNALAVVPEGTVIVGSQLTGAGGLALNSVARLNLETNTWSSLGSGTSGSVSALAVSPGGEVIIGGDFAQIGGVLANTVARYNPANNTWSPLASGLSERTLPQLYALALLPGGDVIAGGFFTQAGGTPVNNIARYSGATNTWSALGTGTSGSFSALAVLPGGDLIAGGSFATAGGMAASRIARYSPATNSWSPIGSGVSGGDYPYVGALAVLPGGDVVVAGTFTRAGGVAANNIARYAPATNTWSALGSGTNGGIYALAVLPGGDVIAGGRFSSAGAVTARNIARYSPATDTWYALGPGTNNDVRALIVLPDGDVIAGGYFSTAGGVTVGQVARYSPSINAWSPLGSGVSGGSYPYVDALAVLPGGDLLAGGKFTQAGGIVSAYLARYTFGSLAACCNPDVNQDGNADQSDIDYLINVVAGGDNPTNIDTDFNHDGNVDQSDIEALINVVAGGACP